MRASVLIVLIVIGCDEGQVRPPTTPSVTAPPAGPIATAAKPELLGRDPATLGPAFDGLALGQAIDQQAAEQFLNKREIHATPFVRDGHLASLSLTNAGHRWPVDPSVDGGSWFDPALHQHATETITEQGTYLQFDLEVPIERWMNMTLDSIVPFDLVAGSMDDAKHRSGQRAWSNYVDGHAHVSWIDSALAGAATATEVSIREVQAFRNTKRTASGWEVEPIPGARTHGLYISLDAPLAIYEQIEKRLTELFGKLVHDRKAGAETWKRSKIMLTHTTHGDREHIELAWER
jgi:hypothetical protein